MQAGPGGNAPQGAPQGGRWIQEKYCGLITWLVGLFIFPCVCCCPCDDRTVSGVVFATRSFRWMPRFLCVFFALGSFVGGSGVDRWCYGCYHPCTYRCCCCDTCGNSCCAAGTAICWSLPSVKIVLPRDGRFSLAIWRGYFSQWLAESFSNDNSSAPSFSYASCTGAF